MRVHLSAGAIPFFALFRAYCHLCNEASVDFPFFFRFVLSFLDSLMCQKPHVSEVGARLAY